MHDAVAFLQTCRTNSGQVVLSVDTLAGSGCVCRGSKTCSSYNSDHTAQCMVSFKSHCIWKLDLTDFPIILT